MILHVFTAVLILSLSQLIHAAHNVTVDNTSGSIVYQGTWGLAVFPGYDIGGSQQLVDLGNTNSQEDASSTATFKFTGSPFLDLFNPDIQLLG